MMNVQLLPAPPKTPIELYEMLPQGTRAELIDNAIYMPPAPSLDHQELSFSLSGELYNFLKKHPQKGKAWAAPIDVFLPERRNAVQPDLIFVLQEHLQSLTADRRRITGVPDLVIEILSEGNMDYDLQKKKQIYEEFGVKEYFAIHPTTHLTYHFYLQPGGHYELVQEQYKKLESKLLAHTFGW